MSGVWGCVSWEVHGRIVNEQVSGSCESQCKKRAETDGTNHIDK